MTFSAPEIDPRVTVRPFKPLGSRQPDQNARPVSAKSSRSTRPPPPSGIDRPTIRLKVGELERTVDEAETALIAADRGVYQRANPLVTVGTAPIITSAISSTMTTM